MDKSNGEITAEEYNRFKFNLTKEKTDIQENLPRLRRELDLLQEVKLEMDEWMELVESCMNIEELDRETVKGLVDHIIVHERVKVDDKTTQDIEISYRFIGSILSNAKEDAAS